MRRSDLNARLREYVRENLSPTSSERSFVSSVYESVQDVLSETACLQIGSYARFTAIRPLHDLDVLYILGDWDEEFHDPSDALAELKARLDAEYVNPTQHRVEISLQTHSVTIRFLDGEDEVFAVDIVPAYTIGTNEFGDDMYMVPELLKKSREVRAQLSRDVAAGLREMGWIRTDPRGYTTVARDLNDGNDDFRKSVKFVKKWRSIWKDEDETFPLKSFHLEQIVTRYFQTDTGLDIFGAVFRFFCELPDRIVVPEIPDRADPDRYIDEYVADLDDEERQLVIEARDEFLVRLEAFDESRPVEWLLEPRRHVRASGSEAYLFDDGIPILTEANLGIRATALQRTGSFRQKILDAMGFVSVDREIQFRAIGEPEGIDMLKWKVKNDDRSPQPRGEITDHRTFRDPEHTKYRGLHYVECYAIRDGVCIAKARQDVRLNAGE